MSNPSADGPCGGDPSDGDETNRPDPRARWSGWQLQGLDPRSGRHAPTIRLTLAVRLWDDDLALDPGRCSEEWSRFTDRMAAPTPLDGSDRAGVLVWESLKEPDTFLHELAPAPRALLDGSGGMRVWRMTSDALHDPRIIGARRPWTIDSPEVEGRSVSVHLAQIGCLASEEGLAFIFVDLALIDGSADANAGAAQPDLADYLDLLHHSRFLRNRGIALVQQQRVDPKSPRRSPPESILAAFDAWKPAEQDGHFRRQIAVKDLFEELFALATGLPKSERSGRSLGNPTTLHAYAYLAVRSRSGPERAGASPEDLVLQIAEMAHAKRQIGRQLAPPDAADEQGVDAFEYSKGAFFALSPECTALVAIDQQDVEFWRDTMPHHFLNEYFAIQILTTYQRHLIDEVRRLAGLGRADATEDEDSRWEAVQDRAIRAKAHGFFIEVSVRTNHARFERALRRTLKVDRAYELAMSLVDSLCETQIAKVEMRRERASRQRERTWQVVAGATIVPTIGLTVLNVNMNGWTVGSDGLSLTLVLISATVMGIAGASLAIFLHRMLERRDGA